MKHLVLGIMFAMSGSGIAQIADPHVLASCGSGGTNTDLRMEWTMGQMGIGQGGNNHYHLTQGFHQPEASQSTVGLPELARLAQAITLWPNPTNETINFRLTTPVAEQLDIAVYDERGATVHTRTLARNGQSGVLPTQGLANGNYIVLLRSTRGGVHGMGRFTKID